MKESFRVLKLREVDSTNEYLKRIPFEENLFVSAEKQLKGRGRRGKSWISKEGKGIYLSAMFPLPPSSSIPLSGLCFAVAVHSVIKEFLKEAYLKWPNDIYVKGRKLSGILVESLKDRLIVGVGVNCFYTKEELEGLEVPATSFLLEGVKVDKEKLTEKLIERLLIYKRKLFEEKFKLSEFEKACPFIGKTVKVLEKGDSYLARVLGVDLQGALVVEKESGGIARIFSADASIRLVE